MEHASLSPFDIAAILITLAAALSWLNHQLFKLPSSVGLALMGALASLLVLMIDWALPAAHLGTSAR
ncbi:MAG: sodium:proton antiporter, partial [Hyphomonadaceae bacterium]